MAAVSSFEDLKIWQKARTFSDRIHVLTLDEAFAKDHALKYQVNLSSGAVMDKIAEGFERGGTKDFIMFLSYAKGAAGETRSQLYRAFDRKYITEKVLLTLKDEVIEISNMLDALIKTLQGSKLQEPESSYNNATGDPDL